MAGLAQRERQIFAPPAGGLEARVHPFDFAIAQPGLQLFETGRRIGDALRCGAIMLQQNRMHLVLSDIDA
jgi:hypothetical protein